MGLAFRFQYASIAWEQASIPVVAVKRGGRVRVRVGSSRAHVGYIPGPSSEYFFFSSRSHMVAQRVTSLPVPAVVGTITVGRLASERVRCFDSRACTSPPLGTAAATTLAVSSA